MTRVGRFSRAALVSALAILAAGCGADSIVKPEGSEARHVANLWWITFALAAFVYAVVAGLIVHASTRGRRTGGAGSRLHDHAFIWIGGIAVPLVILFVIAGLTVSTTDALRRNEPGALKVDVAGKLWWWEVDYPGSGIVTANELHVPVGRPIDLRLTSDNVIHSLWIPELAGKEDAIPGQPNHLRFTPESTGVFVGRCAEYCGLQHAHMALRVIVETPAEFARWTSRRSAVAGEPPSEEAATGAVVFQREACAGCHTVRGTPARGDVGPELSDVGARGTLGAGVLENTPDNLAGWIRDAPSVKPGIQMPSFRSLPDEDVRALVAYLGSLTRPGSSSGGGSAR